MIELIIYLIYHVLLLRMRFVNACSQAAYFDFMWQQTIFARVPILFSAIAEKILLHFFA